MSRFAILRHDGTEKLHWDFLLEMGEVLKTWSLPQPPESGIKSACRALPDHRLEYLDYQGPVSRDRGSVVRWDRGTYDVVRQCDSELVVDLAGEKLVGRVTLTRAGENRQDWQFSFAAGQ